MEVAQIINHPFGIFSLSICSQSFIEDCIDEHSSISQLLGACSSSPAPAVSVRSPWFCSSWFSADSSFSGDTSPFSFSSPPSPDVLPFLAFSILERPWQRDWTYVNTHMGSGCLPIMIMSSTSRRGQQSARDLSEVTRGQERKGENWDETKKKKQVQIESKRVLTFSLIWLWSFKCAKHWGKEATYMQSFVCPCVGSRKKLSTEYWLVPFYVEMADILSYLYIFSQLWVMQTFILSHISVRTATASL